MSRTETLADLALKMGLTPAAAIALPTVITIASARVHMSEVAFISEAMTNVPLRDYLADICYTVVEYGEQK